MQSEFRALNAHLNALGLGLPLAVENRHFTPPDNDYWLAAWFYPAGESALAVNGSNESAGFYQLDINGPVGKGLATIISHADAIRAHFRPGSVISNQYGKLTVSRISIHNSPSDTHAGRILRIYWRSFN